MAKMAADPKTQEWWAIMEPMQQPLDTRGPGEWWAVMEEVVALGLDGMAMTKSFLLSLALLPAGLFADVKLPAVISDHMVLQQDMPVRIWGQADPGEAVSLEFQGQKISGKADAAGKWALFLMPMKAGGPGDVTISGRNSITRARRAGGRSVDRLRAVQHGIADDAREQLRAGDRLRQLPHDPAVHGEEEGLGNAAR